MHRLALFSLLAVLGGCAATPAPTIPATPGPSAPRATPQPSVARTAASTPTPTATAGPNRPVRAGAPTIADPYWLLFNGTSTTTSTAADGTVLETSRGDTYQVLLGGSVEGAILVNGEIVGSLAVTVTEGEANPGLDPIEQQYGAEIDDVPPAVKRSPNPFWTRTAQRRGGLDVFLRVPAKSDPGATFPSAAFWWDTAHEKWYQLTVWSDGRFESALTALLGSPE